MGTLSRGFRIKLVRTQRAPVLTLWGFSHELRVDLYRGSGKTHPGRLRGVPGGGVRGQRRLAPASR